MNLATMPLETVKSQEGAGVTSLDWTRSHPLLELEQDNAPEAQKLGPVTSPNNQSWSWSEERFPGAQITEANK